MRRDAADLAVRRCDVPAHPWSRSFHRERLADQVEAPDTYHSYLREPKAGYRAKIDHRLGLLPHGSDQPSDLLGARRAPRKRFDPSSFTARHQMPIPRTPPHRASPSSRCWRDLGVGDKLVARLLGRLSYQLCSRRAGVLPFAINDWSLLYRREQYAILCLSTADFYYVTLAATESEETPYVIRPPCFHEAALHGFWGLVSHPCSYTLPFSSRDLRLWRHSGFRCRVKKNAGKRMSEVIEGLVAARTTSQPSASVEKVAPCERSTTSSTVLRSRFSTDKVLRFSQTGCRVLVCLDRTSRVSVIGVPWQQTGSF